MDNGEKAETSCKGSPKTPVFLLAILVAALVGCASARLSSEVKPYVGRDIDELVQHLGKPNGKLETTGDRVLVWSTESEGVVPTGSGAEGAGTSLMPVHHECTLEVTVNAENLVRSFQVEGSDAGCAVFRRQLWH
jgi:hypothetical protein